MQINSCYKTWAEDRRQGCLATWLPLIDRQKFCPVFVTGNPNLEVPFKFAPPFLIVRAGEEHNHVAQKVKGFLSWALSRFDCPWLFKCDDDTYLNPKVFNTFPFQDYDSVARFYANDFNNTDITRRDWKPHGAGYSLSHRAAEKVLAEIDTDFPSEDIQVGQIIKTLPEFTYRNLNGTDCRIGPWGGTEYIQPGWMLAHPVYGVAQMMLVHQRVQA
jgi:hypothetical protein